MSAPLIDGKKIAQEIRAEVAVRVAALKAKGVTPGLAVILVGDNPASQVYVRSKDKDAKEAGFASFTQLLPATTTQDELLALVHEYNQDPTIHGILVQLPLPKHINESAIIEAINPFKDVDGFHPYSVGSLLIGEPGFVPCTPAGILELLKRTGVKTAGKHAVIIGRSNIVGKPMAALLLAKGVDCTVTVTHSRTTDLPAITRQADILVAAIGVPEFVKRDMVKPGAVVIDVGINRAPDGKLIGDVAYDEVKDVAGAITPVPGGVGPMTRALLLVNTVQSAERAAAVATR